MEAHMGRGLLLWLIGIPLPIILLAVRRSSSSRPLRCVERCCPSAAQARRSETCSCARTCSMQARRRAGLRSRRTRFSRCLLHGCETMRPLIDEPTGARN
jgi:hypothetical protein